MTKLFKASTRRLALITILYFAATPIAGASFWPSSGHWGETAVGRALARVAPAFGLGGGTPASPLPLVTATKTAQIITGNADGDADPGETIRYTVTIDDATQDATGVHLADTPDPNTTLVGGSIVISPLAINETYASVGNMTLTSASIGGSCGANPLYSVTCNDTLNAGTLTGFGATQGTANGTAPGGSVTTSNSGTVVLNADGTFVYNPAAGFEGADSFWYTLTSPGGIAGTDNAQVTINVGGGSGMVWFVAPGGAGSGRQLNPIALDGFRPLNNGTGTNPAAGDTIFLFEGAHPLTATLTLLGTQKFIGQDTTATLASLGAPAPQPGNSYPSVGNPTGTAVSVTSSAAALTLGSGNVLAGFTVGNSTAAITGGVVGTLGVRDVIVNTTTGTGVSITTSGTLSNAGAFTGFTSVTSTAGANGVSLTGVDGTVNLGSGDLNGNSGIAFNVNGGNATINYSGTIRNSGGRQVSIVNKTGGTVTFSGAVSGTGTGIFLDNNDQSPGTATITFTNGVTLSTGANAAFTATNGGIVTVTGAGNTITTSSGTPLNVANTSIGLSGLTFLSISANGASNGIILNTTGTTAGVNGGLTVTGTGTTPGSGGTIQNITNRGASFITARDISLKNMNFTNANTSDNASPEPAVSTGGNSNVNAAIHINGVTNITLDRLAISGAVQQGINGLSTTGFTLSNSTLSNLGNEADEDGIHFFNMLGTCAITNTTITSSGDDNVNIQNASGTSNITITGGSFNTGVLGSGLLFGPRITSNTTITISGVTSNDNFSGGIVADASDTATMKIDVSGSTVTNNNDGISTSCASGTCKIDIHDNTNLSGNDFVVISMLKAAFSVGGTLNGRIHNNPIPVANGRTTDAVALTQLGGGAMLVSVTNNTITYAGTQRPILLQAGQDGNGSLDATITGNAIDIQLDGVGNAVGILAQASVTSPEGNGASACFDIGGAGGLRNIFTHSLGGVIAGGDLRVRQRFEPTFVRLPGYGGGAMDNVAAASYLDGRNTVVSATTTTVDTVGGGGAGDIVGPGFSGGASCGQPNLAMNLTGRERETLARADVSHDGPPTPALATKFMAAALSSARFITSASSALTPRLNGALPWAALDAVNRVRGGVSSLLTLMHHTAMNGLSASLHASPPPPPVDVDVTPTLPVGKTVRVVFDVTVNTPPVAQYSNFATVSGSNFPDVTTNTVVTPGDRYATTTTLVSSLNPADQGVPVTFTATVNPTEGATTPDGTVQFKDNGVNLFGPVACAAAPANTCTAQLTTSSLTVGTHPITADYLGGTNHDPSTSNTVFQVVNACIPNPVVINNADFGAGSLRQAITDACAAPGSNTITFDMDPAHAEHVVSPIGMGAGSLSLPRDVHIVGPGASVLTVRREVGVFRIFRVNSGLTVTISGLTIDNGLLDPGGNINFLGAGILNQGTLTLSDVVLSNHHASETGGAIYNTTLGSGSASLTIVNSTIRGSQAQHGSGGIHNDASTGGTATVLIQNSTISGNIGGDGGAVYNDGATGQATVTIVNSTISGNQADADGGGLYNNGDANDAVTLTNATITNNQSNRAGLGTDLAGGIRTTGGTVTLRNTIVALNTQHQTSGPDTADDIRGDLDPASASNLIGDGSNMTGVTDETNGNQVGTAGSPIDPKLGALGNNGGPTQTHALLRGSPAIDTGDNTFVVAPPFVSASPITDQRGPGSVRIADSADLNATATVDIGALEAEPTIEDITDKATTEDTALPFSFNVGDVLDSITASSGDALLVTNANLVITGSGSTRTLTITPNPNAFGSTTLTVTATRTIGGTPVTDADTFVLTVTPVADTPSVTNATTLVNMQTTSGLVISRNAGDGGEVGFFKITGLTNGTLFQADGTTPIGNNAFITVAQGTAGLKFTPAADFTGSGSFQVQASVDAIGTGLSSGSATATITVNKHATTTAIVTDDPDPADRFVPVTVVYAVVSADGGPAPTGTVTVTVSGGSETCSGTVAAGQCVITLDVAGVNRTITASYGGDALNDISSDTELHTVNNCPATPIVTTTADSGAGSLRQAIADACGTDTITFNIPGPGPDTIGLTTGELTLDKNLTITGPTSKGLTISGTHTSRVFSVAPGATVALANLTIADGQEVFGGGIFSLGDLTISHSTITGNAAVGSEGGGIDAEGGTLTILNSTISGNTADTDGGGLLNCGDTTALLVNVTITNNRADADNDGFGVGGGIAQVSSNTLTLRNTIVAGNGSTFATPDDVNNVQAGSVIDPASHHNLIGVDTGLTGLTPTNGNLIGNSDVPLDPRLSPLADHGGPTFTHALLAGSPALDAGDDTAAATAGLTTDQRGAGFARVRDAADADTTATVDIGAVEADPVVEDIPDQFSTEDALLSFGFHVGDAATPFDTITATSDTPALVPNAPANLNVTGSGATRTLSIIPAPNAFGSAIITVTVTRGTQSTSDTFTLTVAPAADTLSVTNATTTEDTQTTSGLVISPNAADGAEVTSVRITGITGGTLFQADGTTPIADGDFITVAEGGAGLRFTPAPNATATGHISVQASTDGTILGLGGAIVTADITITPVADTPSITNATTVVNAQTTSGLVISRNAADGAEVTHFQITNIVGGTLFQQDGITPIAGNAFITAAQGAAGLKFTPAPNSTATGHITIQASTSNTAGGLGGGTATADITVTPLPSTTTVATSGSPSNPGQLVTFTATVTPPLAGATGTVQFMDGASPLGSPVTLASGTAAFSTSALASGLHPITAVYSGNTLAQGSTGTLAGGQRVRASVTVVVTSSANPSPLGSPVTIQATPTASGGGTPTGTMTFREGASTLATVPLAAGTAAFTTAAFALGTHTLTIDYAGDGVFMPGSAPFDQIITCPVLTVGPATIAPAILGVPYTQTFTQTGGVGPITFALTGALPGGLTFTPATATISGIPLTLGSYPITVTATPSNGCGGATANYTLFVAAGRTVLTGADAGGAPQVRRFSALDGSTPTGVTAFLAFDAAFTGGVRVAEGDVNGDGAPDFITGAGPGGLPEVRVYDGATGGLRSVITPFEPEFRGGVFVAAGDVNGDGLADVIAGSGEGRSAEIKVFSGRDGTVLRDFFAFAPTFIGGVQVAAGDVNGDGLADLIAGAGPGASDVKVFNAADLALLRTLAPYPGFTGGVFVAAGDVTGDGFADVVTGAGPGGGPHVRVFDGRTGAETFGFFAYAPAFPGGVRVAVGDVTGDGHAEILTGAGPGGTPEVRGFDGATGAQVSAFLAYPAGFTGGVFVATAVPLHRMAIDLPAPATTVVGAFDLAGWAFEEEGPGVGIAGIDIAAVPVGGGAAIPLGAAALGDLRTDVGAAYGAQYSPSGFHLRVTSLLPPGLYDLQVSARGARSGTVNLVRTVRITVQAPPQPLLAIDRPIAGMLSSGTFLVGGWALTQGAAVPPGVDAIDVWAAPVTGNGAWRYLGPATLGGARPDVAAIFGAAYDHAGYGLLVTGLPTGAWDLYVFPRVTGATGFSAPGVVRVAVPPGTGPARALLTGADAGGGPHVRRFSALDGAPPVAGALTSFFAFSPSFTGGVRVAEGDVNGDGAPDYITGAGPGGLPEVRVYDGATGALRTAFLAFEPAFSGGVFVAAGDVDGDGFVDVIVGAGEGRAPEVKVFSGRTDGLLQQVLAFPGFTGGVRVAAGDVNGDGRADLIAGMGPGGNQVTVFNAADLSVLRTLTPYPGFTGGVYVAAGDVNGDGFADLITGAGPGGGPHVRVFHGQTGAELFSFFAYAPTFSGGVRVAAGDVNGDGRADIITGAGPGGTPEVRVFDGGTAALLSSILAYTPTFAGGVFVATAVPVNRIAIDAPATGATLSGPFSITGWAFEEDPASPGVDVIHVWAVPVGVAGAPTFVGAATLGDVRPEVAAAFGPQYATAGYHLTAAGLAPGVYDLVVYARSERTKTFNLQRSVRVTITP